MIELPAAMVRHVHHLDAVLAGDRRVLGCGDALQDQRNAVPVLEALDVVPGEACLVIVPGRRRAPRLDEARRDVALAPAIGGGVDRDAERVVAGIDRAAHDVVHPRIVAAHVELEDLRPGHGLCGLLEPRPGHRTHDDRHAEFGGAAAGGRRAAGIEGFQRTDRRQHHRQAQLHAEECRGRVHLGDVAQHARTQRDRIERRAVAPQCRLALGGADQIAPDVAVELRPRRRDEFVQALVVAGEFGQVRRFGHRSPPFGCRYQAQTRRDPQEGLRRQPRPACR